MAEVDTSSWYPLPGGEAISIEALEQRFDLAQHAPDPTGRYNQRLEANWMFGITADTHGMDRLPTMYQTERTELLAYARVAGRDEHIGVSAMVKTPDGDEHTYGTAEEDEGMRAHNIGMIVVLLGAIADVEMAEFETRPGRVLAKMREMGATTAERDALTRQYDPEQTGKPLAEVKLTKLGIAGRSLQYYVDYLRDIRLGGTWFEYHQEISVGKEGALQWQRAHLRSQPPEGATPGDFYGFELSDDMRHRNYNRRYHPDGDKEISKSDFEAILRASGNILIGPLTGADVVGLLTRPLGGQDPLR